MLCDRANHYCVDENIIFGSWQALSREETSSTPPHEPTMIKNFKGSAGKFVTVQEQVEYCVRPCTQRFHILSWNHEYLALLLRDRLRKLKIIMRRPCWPQSYCTWFAVLRMVRTGDLDRFSLLARAARGRLIKFGALAHLLAGPLATLGDYKKRTVPKCLAYWMYVLQSLVQ